MIGTMFNAFTLLGSEWVLWLLVVLSVISLAIIFERLRHLRSQERLGAKLWAEQLDVVISQGKRLEISPAKATELAAHYPCVEGALLAAMSQTGGNTQDKALFTQSFLIRKKLELEKYLSFLGTVGSNAPFIGLFGTVLGIIKAFHDLGGRVESAGAQTISSGISEALVATAIGLLVAIPAVIFFNYFQRKIKTVIGRAESLSQYLMSQEK
jgi:biopolymer transport protein ExbB